MKTLFGGALLAIGILIAGASGLCSLVFLVSMMNGPGRAWFGALPVTVVVGGIPFAIGMSLVFVGRSLIRSDRDNEGY